MRRTPFSRCLLGFWILSVLCAPVAAVTYPQLALGDGYEAVIIVSNQTDQEWQGSGQLLQRAGQPWVTAWVGGSDFGQLAGQTIRLRFEMKDADLYSLRFD